MSPEMKLAIQRAEMINPAFFKKRLDFHSPEYQSIKIAQTLLFCQLSGNPYQSIDMGWSCLAIRMFALGMPFFHIRPDFCEAVWNTSPPDDLKCSELGLPFDAFMVVLPSGFSRSVFGCDVPFIGACRMLDGESFKWDPKPGDGTVRNSIINKGSKLAANLVSTSSPEGLPLQYSMIGWDRWTFGEMFNNEVEDISHLLPQPESAANTMLSKDDEPKLARNGMKFLLKLLAILNSNPAEMVPASVEHKPRKVIKGVVHYHNPVWLGASYRHPEPIKEGEVKGTHSSPRMHWRRGHVRRQRYGPELKESRLKWIKPVLVNGSPPA